MKRFWCCRDLEGAANEEVFLFVGDFNFDFDKLLGTVKFPELNKGERIEMNLQFEFGIK